MGALVRIPSPSEVNRLSSTKRGYNYAWQKYRLYFLYINPLCVIHLKRGRLVSADTVDHIIPHKGDRQLFIDTSNHQALCKQCHDIKTATEDGGFGRNIWGEGEGQA